MKITLRDKGNVDLVWLRSDITGESMTRAFWFISSQKLPGFSPFCIRFKFPSCEESPGNSISLQSRLKWL